MLDEEELDLERLGLRGRLSRRDLVRSAALAELSGALALAITDVDGVLQRVVELVGGFLGDTAVIRLLSADGTTMNVAAVYDENPAVAAAVRAAVESTTTDVTGLIPHAVVVQHAEAISLAGAAFAAAAEMMPARVRQGIEAQGVQTSLVCPLRVGGRVIGTLGLWRRRETAHSERDRAFAQELADRAALAIENARLIERLRAEIEERKQNEENLRLTAELLRRADEKRRALMDHLVSAQEEERRRIAVDVHDDSIQAMAAIGLRLQIMRRRAPSPEITAQIIEIEDNVTETIGRLRALLFRLESAPVEAVGLARAITRFIAEIFPGGEPRSRVTSKSKEELDPAAQIVMYRIAQEALTNVLKHARATRVSVTIADTDGGVTLTITDDGTGFDPTETARHALPGHLGMRSMQERAEVAGGRLEVESKPGAGTTIRCWVPALDSEIYGAGGDPS